MAERPDPSQSARVETSGSVPSMARRQLLRGSLAVAPVVMTAAPRSVMAATMSTTASAFCSAKLYASHNAKWMSCDGKMPSYWRDTLSVKTTWPLSCQSAFTPCGTALFKDLFGAGFYADNTTMMDVLKNPVPMSNDRLAQYLTAAMLNCKKGLTPTSVVHAWTLRSMWQRVGVRGSYYEPTAGIRWYADRSEPAAGGGGCIAWLKSTMA